MYYTQEQIDRANRADLVSFLRSQGEQLERAGHEYRWKRHDSLTLRENKWYRHSQSKGGGPVDFLMEFFGMSFTEAVQALIHEQGNGKPEQTEPPNEPQFRLPTRNATNEQVKRYLTEARRIDEDVMAFSFPPGIFTRTQPTTTPYLLAGMKAAYRNMLTAKERQAASGSM